MSFEIEVCGNISRDDSGELRARLDGPQLSFASGMAGERILTVIGELTAKQLEAIRQFLLRLLGEDRITGLKIARDGIEVASVSGKHLDALKAAVSEMAQLIDRPPPG